MANRLARDPDNRVIALTMNTYQADSAIEVVRYRPSRATSKEIHPWVAETETKVIRGEAAFRACLDLKEQGFSPDLIVAHPGWGESLFLKIVWPNAKLVIYSEFYYAAHGADTGFDPEFPVDDLAQQCRVQMKNINNLMHFQVADGGLSPTHWQKSTFPEPFRSKIDVIHDGIDTNTAKPNPSIRARIGDQVLSREREIITFVNRNLEPYRGYHVFMRSLPKILRERPNAIVVIVGGDDVSYGAKPPAGTTWKQRFLDEVKSEIDNERVHFVGKVPYNKLIALFQLSSVHVYLTYPFVLSWSLLEAMSCGCAIVASDTPPLREVMAHENTGILTPFFDVGALADRVIELLSDPDKRAQFGQAAREHMVKHYDLQTVTLPRLLQLIDRYR